MGNSLKSSLPKLYSTRAAAGLAGISVTYFCDLAAQERVTPIEIEDSPIVAWTAEMAERVKSARKRPPQGDAA